MVVHPHSDRCIRAVARRPQGLARLARRTQRSGLVARLRGRHATMGVRRVGLRLRVGVRAQHLAHASEESGVGRVTTPTLA